MPFNIIRNDITKVKADAIVNTANPKPIYASGTDHAIYTAAGAESLLAERKKIGDIAQGDVAVTPAFALKAKYIIHTVGPSWQDGMSGEFETLASCYTKSLKKAAELECESIAFPLISTGVYGFPKDKALQIAISCISSFLMTHEMQVILVVFDRASFQLSGRVFDGVDAQISEHDVHLAGDMEYGLMHSRLESVHMRELEAMRLLDKPMAMQPTSLQSMEEIEAELDKLLKEDQETFQQCLFRMIDARGLTDPEVYFRANLDRKLFSKIRCNKDYQPKKKTAVALAVGLHLNMEETEELLGKAGWTLGSASKFDRIVSHYIRHGCYDIWVINPRLFDEKQPLLGA